MSEYIVHIEKQGLYKKETVMRLVFKSPPTKARIDWLIIGWVAAHSDGTWDGARDLLALMSARVVAVADDC